METEPKSQILSQNSVLAKRRRRVGVYSADIILFKKKYDLINGFTADFREGRRDERYARRIGLIEFVTGIVLVLIGVSLLLLTANGWM